ncbi:hypothetical protein OESDEN_21488 [Oesophagostomum dentatum]|uniref:Proteolipid membrane potential modulator n=1 Tax=Oesophagostomum dentatum TaxID=61180 RepID=A0A0B1S1R6_OESDE|nr:hypothetical protein OESDEN_21488 [Oesophagostomum dentatum]
MEDKTWDDIFIEIFFIIFMPPLAVLYCSKRVGAPVLLCALLTFFLWIPGMLYATCYCFIRRPAKRSTFL